jgi:hypothetical protein
MIGMPLEISYTDLLLNYYRYYMMIAQLSIELVFFFKGTTVVELSVLTTMCGNMGRAIP